MKVSLILVAHNEEENLAGCLNSILQQSRKPDEWVLIDNDSSDKTFKVLDSFKSNHPDLAIQVVSRTFNHLGIARSEGLRMATGEAVAFIDADCFAAADWLENLHHKLTRAHRQDQKVVGVGGPNRLPKESGPFAEGINRALNGPLSWFKSPQSWTPPSDLEVDHLATTNAIFLKKPLLEIGGFSSEFRFSGEDLDLGWRLNHHQYKLLLSPSPVITNACAANFLGWLSRLFRFGQARRHAIAVHKKGFFGEPAFWILPIYFGSFALIVVMLSFFEIRTVGQSCFASLAAIGVAHQIFKWRFAVIYYYFLTLSLSPLFYAWGYWAPRRSLKNEGSHRSKSIRT